MVISIVPPFISRLQSTLIPLPPLPLEVSVISPLFINRLVSLLIPDADDVSLLSLSYVALPVVLILSMPPSIVISISHFIPLPAVPVTDAVIAPPPM